MKIDWVFNPFPSVHSSVVPFQLFVILLQRQAAWSMFGSHDFKVEAFTHLTHPLMMIFTMNFTATKRLGCCWFIVRHDLRSGNWGTGEDYVADVYFVTLHRRGDVGRGNYGGGPSRNGWLLIVSWYMMMWWYDYETKWGQKPIWHEPKW